MDDNNWSKILREIYDNGGKIDYDPYNELDDNHTLRMETGMSNETIEQELDFLYSIGLIEEERFQGKDQNGVYWNELVGYNLTEKGFDVAHSHLTQKRTQELEFKRSMQQNEVNIAIGYLTLGILFIAFGDVVLSIISEMGAPDWILQIGLAVLGVVIFVLIILLARSGLLDRDASPESIRI